ncbi:MAG TPA: hypothetical protein VGJ88_08025 [Thermoanaerobaculia bacterium]|jgi:hypothetical protein
MRTISSLAFILALTSIALCAQTVPGGTQRILLPIRPLYVPGALGSAWLTEVGLANLGDSALTVYGVPSCTTEGCPSSVQLAAHSTGWAGLIGGQCSSQGMLLAVDTSRASDLALTERTHDTSRDANAWGVMVPVVRDDQMPPLRFSLVDVPMDPRFRVMLRVYDIDPATPPSVRVRAYAENYPDGGGHADTLLTEFMPTFASNGQPFCVASAEILVSNDPLIKSASRVRFEIESLDGRRDYWAFASVTNNDTQEVSVIAPQ